MDPWQPCPDTNSTLAEEAINSCDITNVESVVLHNEDNSNRQNLVAESISTDSVSTTTPKNDSFVGDLSFGDNFQPFVKLPDSQEYINSLEHKLKLIQKGGKKGANADAILRSLGQTKESCMLKLLSNSVEKLTTDDLSFEELRINPLLKKIAPEKQALTAEELVHLLKADQLDIILNNNLEEELTPQEPEATNHTAADSDKDQDSTENLNEVTSEPSSEH